MKRILFGLAMAAMALVGVGAQENDAGIVFTKNAQALSDGSYRITLEAYATGTEQIVETITQVPADIVLVVDQSGSMAYAMNPDISYSLYSKKTNADYYELRHNGGYENLWWKEGDAYCSVSVTRTETYTAVNVSNPNQNSLYVWADGEYRPVTKNGWEYSYVNASGQTVRVPAQGTTFYTASASYAYSWQDDAGIHEFFVSEGSETQPSVSLYARTESDNVSGGALSRKAALQEAASSFVQTVAAKAEQYDVDHRIAVVGYGGGGEDVSTAGYVYASTGLYDGSRFIGYKDLSADAYASAFKDMNTSEGVSDVLASISSLTARGGTHTNLGLEMANHIFEANPIGQNEQRSRVVILFTDGEPGEYGYNHSVADKAVAQASISKTSYGATVYAIGIFGGADPSSTDTNANKFMHNVSSNNGTVQNPGYYLSAKDSATLSNIFQNISDNIITGGTTTTLTSAAVVKDIISPYFVLKTSEDETVSAVTLYTSKYIGQDQWDDWQKADYDVQIQEPSESESSQQSQTIEVSGFDFSANWCGKTTANNVAAYRGMKLVIQFDIAIRPGFLGGNGVSTNKSAGIYESANAQTPVISAQSPTVDIALSALSVTAADHDIFLSQTLTQEQLLLNSVAVIGQGEQAVSASYAQIQDVFRYGFEPWQTEFVTLTPTIQQFPVNTSLMENTAYTISLTLAPKNNPDDSNTITATDTAMVYVYKPTAAFADSFYWYGQEAEDLETVSPTVSWTCMKNGEVQTAAAGQAPVLSWTADLPTGTLNSKTDIEVKVQAFIGNLNITDHTTIVRTPCEKETGTIEGAYLLHPKTCSLTIQKTGGDDNEPYTFYIYKDGSFYTETFVMGNGQTTICQLPLGEYEIQEDLAWNWRWTSQSQTVQLTQTNPNGQAVIANTKIKSNWLDAHALPAVNTFEETP